MAGEEVPTQRDYYLKVSETYVCVFALHYLRSTYITLIVQIQTFRWIGEAGHNEFGGCQPDPCESLLSQSIDGVDGVVLAGDAGNLPIGDLLLELGIVPTLPVGVSCPSVVLLSSSAASSLSLLSFVVVVVVVVVRPPGRCSSALTGVDLAQDINGVNGIVFAWLTGNVTSVRRES